MNLFRAVPSLRMKRRRTIDPAPAMNLPALIVFDMAGTTIEAGDLVPLAFMKAFEYEGIQLSESQVSEVRGRSKTDAIYELLQRHAGDRAAQARYRQVHDRFRQSLLAAYSEHGITTIDGAGTTFSWAQNANIRIALTTGFDRELAQLLCRLAGWTGITDTLVSGTDVAQGRPAPDLVLKAMKRTGCTDSSRVAVVGDTISDIRSAKAAAAGWSIGVLSGAHGHVRLAAESPTVILDSVADLPRYFEA